MAKPIYGNLELKNESELRFADADSSAYAALKAASTLTASVTWTLPDADADGFLKSNGSGVFTLQALTSADLSDFDQAAQDAVAAMFNSNGDLDFTYDDPGDTFTAVLIPTAITGKPSATVAAGDLLLVADVDDSNNLKQVTAQSVAYLASVSSFKTDWIDTDGATKGITHNLNTLDVIVQIFDKVTNETILVDSEVRTDVNTLTLSTDGIAPSATGWRVLILAV